MLFSQMHLQTNTKVKEPEKREDAFVMHSLHLLGCVRMFQGYADAQV